MTKLAAVFQSHHSGYWGVDAGAADVDVRAIRNGDVGTSGELRWDSLPLRGFSKRECERALVRAGDIVLTTSGNCGNVAFISDNPAEPTAATNFVRILRTDSDAIDPRYAFHFLRTRTFRDALGPFIRGATIQNLSAAAAFDVIQIPTPALVEQRRIAAILDQADALRANRRQLIAHLETLTESIFSDMFGDPDSAGKNIHFGEVAGLSGGRNLVADDPGLQSPYRVLKISAVTSGLFKPHESKPLPADYVPPESHLVRRGDLLMSRANTTELVGAVAHVHDTPTNLALPDKVWRFDWREPGSVPSFYHALFRSPSMRRRISRLSSGTGGSMKNVSKANLESMLIPKVAVVHQRAFARLADCVEAQRLAAQRGLSAYDELFDALRTCAFRGEL